jgi:RNA-directed DNA polymerase
MGKIRDEIRRWKLHLRPAQSIAELAREINPKLRGGWFNYYGRFNPAALRPIERHVGQWLVRWACRKYKTLRNHRTRAWQWLLGVIDRQPDLLALWERRRYAVSTIGAV